MKSGLWWGGLYMLMMGLCFLFVGVDVKDDGCGVLDLYLLSCDVEVVLPVR